MPPQRKPWRQRKAATIFLRVPPGDWPAVKYGHKSEFRTGVRGHMEQAWKLKPPCPAVCYTLSPVTGYDARLMLLEDFYREPLGAISEDSLRREGFASLAEFRRYFMERERRHFTPTRMICVFRVRPWRSSDAEPMAMRFLERLYGEWLDSGGDAKSLPPSAST